MRPRIVVVGSTNADLVVSVPRIPLAGETVLGSGSLVTTQGGKGANQAVAAARLGGDVTFITRVGDDDLGRRALAVFGEEGIDTTYALVTSGTATGVAMIAVASSGENSISVAPGANALLSPEDVEAAKAVIAEALAVVLSLEVPLETVSRAAEIAAAHQIPVILNPAPACALPSRLLENVTYLTPNEGEAYQLAGLASQDADLTQVAKILLATGIENLVITLGTAGARTITSESDELVPAFQVSAVDTVAAGDCFTGALSVEIASLRPLPDAVRFANAAAAVKVTRHGAQTGLPHRREVIQFLERANDLTE